MILAVLQARMSSTRLPGKVLKPLLGRPMIERQIERLGLCRRVDRLVVATSDDPGDDELTACLVGLGVAVFRGPLDDVLGRFVGALDQFGPARQVVRLTADCPLTDWRLIDRLIEMQVEFAWDYCANDLVRTWPQGLDAEIMTADALRTAAAEATDPGDREHVTPFIYNRRERFAIGSLTHDDDLSGHRWTVDTPDDFAFVERVYEALYSARPAFTTEDILALPFQRLQTD